MFTKVMKPVMRFLRKKGISCMVFIDDILFLSPSKSDLIKITMEIITLLHQLGFQVNWSNSDLVPSQKSIFLGFILDSLSMTLTLPEEKMVRIL